MRHAATKTTFYLSDSIRTGLKSVALRRKTTVTDLLVEGAGLVLERYRGTLEREDLVQKAAEARERMRRGLYDGPVVESIDELVYGKPKRTEPRRKRTARGR